MQTLFKLIQIEFPINNKTHFLAEQVIAFFVIWHRKSI